MKSILLFFTLIIFMPNGNFNLKANEVLELNITVEYQDKTHLINKVKAKKKALAKKRTRLKLINKWSELKEKKYQEQIERLNHSLKKLGNSLAISLNTDEIIEKLQKELKYLNNKRVNKNAVQIFSQKDDSIYKVKAAVLIDSIIKLRMKKK